jgi:ArsR family transcriptional regulator
MEKGHMQNLTQIFKALSDETRLRILSLMKKGEICVCDIAETLNMTQPNISFHLSVLKESGLIQDRKNGRWIHYSLDESDMFRRFLLFSIFENIKKYPAQELKRSKKC